MFSERGPTAHASLQGGGGGSHTATMMLCIFSVEGEGDRFVGAELGAADLQLLTAARGKRRPPRGFPHHLLALQSPG